MGLTHSPSLITDGLIMNLDAANIKSYPIQRNLLLSSTTMFANWATNASVVRTANAGAAPDRTDTAVRFDTSSTNAGIYQYLTLNANETYTYSVYLKYISGEPAVRFGSDNGIVAIINFNTISGTYTIGSGSPSSIVVTSLPNGWYRVSFAINTTASTYLPMVIFSSSNAPSSFLAWGPQIERSKTVQDYVPTTNFLSFFDMSSNQTNGLLAGGASYSGLNGGQIVLDGIDGRINHTSNLDALNNISGSSSFTMSIFMKLNSMPAFSIYNTAGILQKNSYDTSFGINILFSGNTGGFRDTANLYCGIRNIWYASTPAPAGYGNIAISTGTPLSLNQWYRIDMVHTFSVKTHTITAYINGALFATVSDTNELYPINITNTAPIGINTQLLGGNFLYANISVSNYQIYNRALSATEIKQNYDALKVRFGL